MKQGRSKTLTPMERALRVLGKQRARRHEELSWSKASYEAILALLLEGSSGATEILGHGSCGKTSLCLSLVQDLSIAKRCCAFIDVDRALGSWLRSSPVEPSLKDVTFLEPRCPKEAAHMVHYCLARRFFDVLVVDSVGHAGDEGFTQPFLTTWCDLAKNAQTQLIIVNPGFGRARALGGEREASIG